jgi:hypothetical protein
VPSAYDTNEEQTVAAESDTEADEAAGEESWIQQQSLSPEEEQEEDQKRRFLASTAFEKDEEEEASISPEVKDKATPSKLLQHDADEGGDKTTRSNEPCSNVAMEGEDVAEQCDPDAVPSEFDGDDDGLLEFDIPPTPPYDDDMLLPLYVRDSVEQFHDTPTSAQPFTDGKQIFDGFLSPTGQQLYTDGEQVFMLACVEVPAESGTSCAWTHDGADPCGMLVSCYGGLPDTAAHAGQSYGGANHSCANDGVEVDDLWNVCWEDFMPEAFAAPAEI